MTLLIPEHRYNEAQQKAFDTLEATWGGEAPTTIGLGDSRMNRWSGSTDAGWFDDFGEAFPGAANLGIGRQTSADMQWQLENMTVDISEVTLVLGMIGINDIHWLGRDPFYTGRIINYTANWLRQRCAPGARIVFFNVFPADPLSPRTSYNNSSRKKLNKELQRLSDKQHFFELCWVKPEPNVYDLELYLDDQVHFQRKMYTDVIGPAIEAFLA